MTSPPAKPDPNPTPENPDETSPNIDDGPPPEPVDEIQAALFEAAQKGARTDVDIDQLLQAAPVLDTDPQPGATADDEVQAALAEAAQKGISPNVDFDTLPAPTQPLPELPATPAAPPGKPRVGPAPPAEKPSPAPAPQPRPKPVPMGAPAPDFWLALALFAVFRLLTLVLLRPGGYIRDWSDFDTYFGISALSDYGLYPFLHFWLEWPPLVPWLAVGAYKLALLLPPWPDDPRLWFILILGWAFALFEIGNFVLIHRLGRRFIAAPRTLNRVLWLYAGLFPPVYAMLGFFDGVALFFILLALDFILDDRRALSAIAVAGGVLVKVVPLLMLPVAIRRIWYQHREQPREAAIESSIYTVVAGLAGIAIVAPFLYLGPQWLMASLRAMAGRSSWETVWAIAEGYYGFGVVLGDRLNPAETAFAAHPGGLPWWVISLLFGALYLFIATRPADYQQPRNVVAFAGLTTVLLLVYNKGYSPQFLVYLLPFIVLLMPNGRGLVYALTLTMLNVLEQPIYFVMLPDAHWLLTLVVGVRLLVHLLLAVEFGLMLWPLASAKSAAGRAHAALPRVLGIGGAAALLLLTPFTFGAYAAGQAEASPTGALVSFMQSQAGPAADAASPPRLLLSDQATYRQLYPHLADAFDLRLTDGPAKGFGAAPAPADLLQNQRQVWLLPTGPQAGALRNIVTNRGTQIASYNFGEAGVVSLVSFERNPVPVMPPARFIGGIELLGHRVETGRDAVNVTLFWRAAAPQNQNLTVFAQLLNAEGELVAGHDSQPVNDTRPVTGWPQGVVQADPHAISLPADLPPGSYSLIVGLYNDAGARVQAFDPAGASFPSQAVPLGEMTLE
ncbi:MAG: hypothetical protein Kow0031_31470 [Anaerolineae bacterium]